MVRFFADGSDAPENLTFRPTIESLPRPIFAYSYQMVDNRNANENGQLEKGEGGTVYLHVKNVGEGPAYETQANLRNLTGDGVLLKAGRFDVSGMKPGESRDVAFTFDLLKTVKGKELELEMTVADRDLGVYTVEKIKVPIFGHQVARTIQVLADGARTATEVAVLDQPEKGAEEVGQVQKGVSLAVQGEFKDFYKIDLGEGRFAFAKKSELLLGDKGAPFVFAPAISRAAPRLDVNAQTLATRGDSVSIDVTSTDTTGGVQDAFIFVGSDKVFYTPNPTPHGKEMKFTFDAPLKAGVNVITVVARENEDVATRHRIVVRKDGPNGEILPTPTNDLFGEDWEFGAP